MVEVTDWFILQIDRNFLTNMYGMGPELYIKTTNDGVEQIKVILDNKNTMSSRTRDSRNSENF